MFKIVFLRLWLVSKIMVFFLGYLELVWKCGYGYFLKYFLQKKYIKIIFFLFKKLFLSSAHQNNLKIQKNINLKQRKIKNFKFFLKYF
jgi:hypothetical protein